MRTIEDELEQARLELMQEQERRFSMVAELEQAKAIAAKAAAEQGKQRMAQAALQDALAAERERTATLRDELTQAKAEQRPNNLAAMAEAGQEVVQLHRALSEQADLITAERERVGVLRAELAKVRDGLADAEDIIARDKVRLRVYQDELVTNKRKNQQALAEAEERETALRGAVNRLEAKCQELEITIKKESIYNWVKPNEE